MQPDFGPNVTIFDPSMPASDIQAALDRALNQQVSNQFGSQRYAFLFKPGQYDVDAQLGYYTSVAGLGLSPDDVTINGEVRVEGQLQSDGTYSALDNFWRSAENLSVNPIAPSYYGGAAIDQWAVSQAAPLRRVHIRGALFLFPHQGGFASGGFLADSLIGGGGPSGLDGLVVNSSQQQWLTRNSVIGSWSNGVWNQVFSGVVGAPAQNFPPNTTNPNPYTTLPQSPVTREKPFLYTDSVGNFNVFVPALKSNSSGTTWENGPATGSSLPIDSFFIAKPTDSALKINIALALGKHLILTPGIYHLDEPLLVLWPDTVVLGLGFPTLVPGRGNVSMVIA
ncbi:MAG: adenylyl cyclase, partial [Verrucomicrobia bacterium]|nr:adenylyl cyclase [Verrucomicrobiota bacterium]